MPSPTSFNRTNQYDFDDDAFKAAIEKGLINGTTLAELYLSGTSVTLQTLADLDAPNLITLEIGTAGIDNNALAVIAKKFPKLKRLSLPNSAVTSGFEVLANLPLEALDVHNCTVGDNAVEAIAIISTLQILALHCTKATLRGLQALWALSKLSMLDIRGLGISLDEADDFRLKFSQKPTPRVAGGEYTQP